uniref:Uncharacterized protein n=1 Tax=Anguilla anguilla TaxID=7936 RepID=A0A0E9UF76_ANGAN
MLKEPYCRSSYKDTGSQVGILLSNLACLQIACKH